ncbi:hypothetical protein K210_04820 [Erysipelothrix rhusiopathiae SY1027]|nr:hypothetical protein K210_04820 [Erysipelothrix rhusiopathiae SY1027]
MKMNTSFSQELLHLIEKNIPEIKFYSLNRRLRNNIHYNKINKLSDDDFNLVKNCQAIYIDTCLNFINSHLNINLTNEVISVTEYNRLALEKSIPLEELLRNHKEYYTSFLKTGSIERTNKKYESKVK